MSTKLSPWRLALLFFISGVALRFALDKAGSINGFTVSRVATLGVPLLFGVMVLVMPQTYFQLRQSGAFTGGLGEFYLRYLQGQLPIFTPTWNHLWYIAYLLAYTLLIAPLAPLLRRVARSRIFGLYVQSPPAILLLTILPFVIYEATLSRWFPITDDFIHDWGQHAQRLTILLLGFLAAKDRRFWASVCHLLPVSMVLVVLLYIANAMWQPGNSIWAGITHLVMQVLYAWSCIIAMLAFGQRYLNRPSKTLRYLTGAIFCYYAVHQTVIVVAGYYLTQLHLGAWLEFSILVTITVCSCAAVYEVGRRTGALGILVGIQQIPAQRRRN